MIVWCCVFIDLRFYIFAVSLLLVCAWRAVCMFVLGLSWFVFSVLFECFAGDVECVVDGGGFMVWASCHLCSIFFVL